MRTIGSVYRIEMSGRRLLVQSTLTYVTSGTSPLLGKPGFVAVVRRGRSVTVSRDFGMSRSKIKVLIA
jgi:hypothetical protein